MNLLGGQFYREFHNSTEDIIQCQWQSKQIMIYLITTRNTLDRDQSNYSSRIVFSHIPIEFGQTRISAIQSDDPENPILEPNTE